MSTPELAEMIRQRYQLLVQRAELAMLLLEALDYGNRMSTALGNDEMTIPWDDDLQLRIRKALLEIRKTG
jgi:hypothetical protein